MQKLHDNGWHELDTEAEIMMEFVLNFSDFVYIQIHEICAYDILLYLKTRDFFHYFDYEFVN